MDLKLDTTDIARWQALTVPSLIERAGLRLDHPAIVFEDRVRTYGELREFARRVSNGLIDRGIDEMDRVAVLSNNRLEFIEIEVGIAGARAVMVPLNWRLRRGELGNLLRRSEARAVFVADEFAGTVAALRADGELPGVEFVVGLGDTDDCDIAYEEFCAAASDAKPERGGLITDPHEIIYTSGTTGDPKGAVWSNGTLIFNSIQQVMDYRLTADSVTYCVIDLYYIGGRHDFTWAVLHQGGTVHVKPSGDWDTEAVVGYVAEHGVTHILWVPTMLYDVLRLPGLDQFDTSRLQMIMSGGAPVSKAVTEQAQAAFPHTDFIQVYGLTEGGGTVTFISRDDAKRKAGSAGKASMHNEIVIRDSEGAALPDGEVGEITVRGPSVTAGYWDAPEMTAAAVRDGWLWTGDMGSFDDEGFLFVSGRSKDMIISGGMNIFPAEIEDTLRAHPVITDAAVVGMPHERWGEQVVAVVEASGSVDEADVIAFCKERLASYKKPSSVVVYEEIPRTPSGKAKKHVIRDELAGHES